MKNFMLLKEKALANIDHLFSYWKLEYVKINEEEYDFINPNRTDHNFGACRFNISKGLGADFTGASFTQHNFESIGVGFTREDFSGFNGNQSVSVGFDIIGLVQRLYSCPSYKDAAKLLDKQLADLAKTVTISPGSLERATKREYDIIDANKKRIQIAKRTWDICIPIQNTLGQIYLNSRMIFLEQNEPALSFHPKIYNSELKCTVPAILLKCTKSLDSPLQAIHRIYLSPCGTMKANLSIPKKALGNIKGLGIWFGSPKCSQLPALPTLHLPDCSQKNISDTPLCIVEGPENALSIRSLGYGLVVSTIDASNFSNLTIPEYIQKIILMPDGDKAGQVAAQKAIEVYSKVCPDIKIIFPPKNINNPKWDWNDELQLRGKNVRRETRR